MVAELIRDAAREYAAEHQAENLAGTPAAPVLSEEALLALARVLSGPRSTIYRATSKSDPSKSYTLTVDGGDVACSCPGFEYRGACSHSRELKAALVGNKPLPAGLVRSEE